MSGCGQLGLESAKRDGAGKETLLHTMTDGGHGSVVRYCDAR